MNPRIIRFPTRPCWLCGRRGWYTCPSCETVSCSLACCQKHKEVAECTGDWRDAIFDGNPDPSALQVDAHFLLDTEARMEAAGLRCSSLVTPHRIRAKPETDKVQPRDLLTQVCDGHPQTAEQRRVKAALARLDCVLAFSPFRSGRETLSYVDTTGGVHIYTEAQCCDFKAVRTRLVANYAREYFQVSGASDNLEKPPFPVKFFLGPDDLVSGVRTVLDLAQPLDLAALNFHGRPHLLTDLGGIQKFLPLEHEKPLGEALRGTIIVDYLKLVDVIDGEVDVGAITSSVVEQFKSQNVSESRASLIVGKLDKFVRFKQRLHFPVDAAEIHTWAEVRARLAKVSEDRKRARRPPQNIVDEMDNALQNEAIQHEIERFEQTEQKARLTKQAKQ